MRKSVITLCSYVALVGLLCLGSAVFVGWLQIRNIMNPYKFELIVPSKFRGAIVVKRSRVLETTDRSSIHKIVASKRQMILPNAVFQQSSNFTIVSIITQNNERIMIDEDNHFPNRIAGRGFISIGNKLIYFIGTAAECRNFEQKRAVDFASLGVYNPEGY